MLGIWALTASAQKDLQIQFVNPQDGFEINDQRPFPVNFRVKNVGTDTIQTTDTFNVAILLNFQVIGNQLRGAVKIAPGDSLLLSPPNGGLNLTFTEELDSALMCVVAFFADSTIDTNDLNNGDCVLGSLKFFPTTTPELAAIANSVKAYPNPASQTFTISLTADNVLVEILDVSGKLIETVPVSMGEARTNVSNYANGIYVYRIQSATGANITTGRFSVIH